jgi:hypothetical protein
MEERMEEHAEEKTTVEPWTTRTREQYRTSNMIFQAQVVIKSQIVSVKVNAVYKNYINTPVIQPHHSQSWIVGFIAALIIFLSLRGTIYPTPLLLSSSTCSSQVLLFSAEDLS